MWDDGIFYAATVASFNANTGKFRLVYDDGDVEVLRLEADPSKRQADDVIFRWLPQDDGGPASTLQAEEVKHCVAVEEPTEAVRADTCSPAETAPAAEDGPHAALSREALERTEPESAET